MHSPIILDRVMRAIALNRAGGFHFAGRFLDADFEEVAGGMRGMLEAGPHCTDAGGEIDMVSLSIFFDIVLGTSIRTTLGHFGRLATTNIHLRLNGVPRVGPVRTEARYQGTTTGTAGKFATSQLELTGSKGVFAVASGSFAVMSGQEMEVRFARIAEPPALTRQDLAEQENLIMTRAEAALRHPGSFIAGFWGVDCRMTDVGSVSTTLNGAHVANRVGHLQGGAQLGIAEITAGAALGPDWMTTSIDASYLRPGEGTEVRGAAEILHRGRTTAAISTRLSDAQGRVILTAASTHAKRG